MKTLKTRLAKFSRLVKGTWARTTDTKLDIMANLGHLVSLIVLFVPTFILVVICGK